MKYEDKKNLIIIFIMIAFLATISMWRFKKFEEAMVEVELPKIEMPEIKPFELDLDELKLEDLGLEAPKPLTLEELKQNYETFISPDKTIQMKYPSHWQEIDPVFLEKISQEMKELGLEQNEILFFAYQKRLIEFPPILTVISMPPEMGLEKIVKEIKRIAKEQQIETEIIKTETKNDKTYFQAEYIKENQVIILKGKIVFTEKRNYLISILIPSELQEEMSPEIDFIFDSIINIQSP